MKTKDVTYMALFTALIAIGSKIQIPLDFIGMHFTLQWLFVLLCALLLNRKHACLTYVEDYQEHLFLLLEEELDIY